MAVATCRFVGRLGNQLWQIGATINYALKHNMNFGFPNRTVDERHWPMMFKNLPRTNESPKMWKQPDDGAYYHIPFCSAGITLMGFFQSYRYLDHPDAIPTMKKLIGYHDKEPIPGVAIHVRRGDYVQLKNTFPCLPIDYYNISLRCFHNPMNVTVFSDDIEWCKSEFPQWFKYHQTGDPVDDLFYMSQFEHQIIANSSYSYWAAMLNPNPNKIVVCPHYTQYYGPGNAHLNTKELYPPSWRQIRF